MNMCVLTTHPHTPTHTQFLNEYGSLPARLSSLFSDPNYHFTLKGGLANSRLSPIVELPLLNCGASCRVGVVNTGEMLVVGGATTLPTWYNVKIVSEINPCSYIEEEAKNEWKNLCIPENNNQSC